MTKSDGTLGIEEAARMCGVSDETLRRRLRAGRFVGAFRTGGSVSAWRIPVADLLAEGFTPRFDAEAPSSLTALEGDALRRELAVAVAVADERAARITSLEQIVAALTAALTQALVTQ